MAGGAALGNLNQAEVLAMNPESSFPRPELRCAHCGEMLGVYERLVEVFDGMARETSRAAEPDLFDNPSSSLYHADCFSDCR
jgi:hypothetical protein